MYTAILIYYQIGVYFLPGFQNEAMCKEAVRAYNARGSAYYGVCVKTRETL